MGSLIKVIARYEDKILSHRVFKAEQEGLFRFF